MRTLCVRGLTLEEAELALIAGGRFAQVAPQLDDPADEAKLKAWFCWELPLRARLRPNLHSDDMDLFPEEA